MSQPIEELLQQCTVRLNLPGKYGHGTGFFVAPGLILTCAHVVKGLKEGERITVRWQGQDDFAQADIEQTLPTFDLALLRFTPPEGGNVPCVYLDESVKRRR
ncbi:MAG: serine protease [Cyanobacteria bacterium J06636_28]